ncbi:RCC1 domain-containing protein [Bacillus thuringiensis]|uniref:RCC1 domain-containing protein n=1 Tax=Bacillus thuringiensis TaxID=1428 RepID=UPI0021D679DF|nr:hypothetical protein [Bacillus thuringiensis]MCU7667096.1 hypothetical protein [Bacillus thuringiensis]
MKLRSMLLKGMMFSSIVLAPKITMANTDIGIDSPIDKAYAGQEFVLFLHKDTSISGFGANVNDTLGKSGGQRFNTGEIVKVSGPTGFKFIKTSKGYAHGFRPLAENESLYDWYQIGPTFTKSSNEPVKDASITGRTSVYENPHDTSSYVTEKGEVKSNGSDYWLHLGFGKGFPYGRYSLSGWNNTLALENEQTEILPKFSNEDNSNSVISVTSNEFTTNGSPVTIAVQYRDVVEHITKTTLNINVINSSGSVVYSNSVPYKQVQSDKYSDYIDLPIYNLPGGTYKLDVSSSKTKWDISVKNRVHFHNAEKVFRATESSGRFIVVDDQNKIYFHDKDYGYLKEVVFPLGIDINKNSISSGMGNHFAMIDTQGRAWILDGMIPSLVSVPTLGSYNFYDMYTIKKVSVGLGFTMMIAENKITKETEVWTIGSNAFGKLGLGNIGTSLKEKFVLPNGSDYTYNVDVKDDMATAVRVIRKENPINNVQDIATGANFSVIVQNTSEGQLVWTSGQNNRGQLGGGTSLSIYEPQIVPGLSNIKKVISQNAVQVLALSDNKIYSFGGNKSYPSEFTMPYGLGMIDDWQQHTTAYWRQDLTSVPTSSSVVIKDNIPYGIGHTGYGAMGSSSQGGKIRIANAFVGDSSLGRDPNDLYFENIKSASTSNMSGGVVDKNGRLWGWGYINSAGLGDNQYDVYGPDGISWIGSTYAHPMVLDNEQPAPAIFKQYSGIKGNGGYALTTDGKLWMIGRYVSPINGSYAINSVNIVKLFTGLSNNVSALDNSGNVWRWSYGGVPTKIDSSKFQNRKIVDISEGNNHALFIDETGYVWALGDNAYGKLGDGTENNASNPVKVLNVTDANFVEAGLDFSYAIDKKGRVWAWGYSSYGSLGNNFTTSRNTISTAVGNDLPEMSISNDIKDYYLSKNGNQTFNLHGTIREKERETTDIQTTILGINKQTKVDASDWELDIYDRVKPKNWNVEVNVNDVSSEQMFQSLIKVAAEDERGGLVEQFFAGRIVIDNEKPTVPNWGDTCVVKNNGAESCYASNYFQPGGTNGVNNAVRLYLKPIQKTGDNKAPVKVQIQYRIKQPYGYPIAWSDWIDVETKNQNGYYYDFLQGFSGETQVKLRSIDEAGNVSDKNSEYRYVIINNAGAEIDKMVIGTKTVEKQLINDITFSSITPDGSAIKNYGVKRRLKGVSNWIDLTPNRVAYETTEETIYSDLTGNLLGNSEYEYALNVENSVAIGKEKISSVITNPYEPINFFRKVNTNGIVFTVKQDERNRGEILYRLVIIDNQTGELYSVDKKSSNIKEEVIFNVKGGDTPFSILNNSMTIKLLVKGLNGKFTTIVYDEDFENTPSIASDKQMPEVYVSVEGNPEKIISYGDNKVNLSFSATDDVTINNKLSVQFSADGTNWYGVKGNGTWEKNLWGKYSPTYKNFVLGETPGVRLIYARVKDEAGNIGVGNTKILISDVVKRDEDALLVDSNKNTSSKDTVFNAIYVNNVFVELNVPKTGNITEAQYSFDGVNWSPWEPLIHGSKKYIALPSIEGEHSVITRFKNVYGDITTIKENNDVLKYVLDKTSPELIMETVNGTRITKQSGMLLNVTAIDNLSRNIKMTLVSNGLEMLVNGVKMNAVTLSNNAEQEMYINGLKQGFNVISFDVQDEAGNTDTKTLRIYKK